MPNDAQSVSIHVVGNRAEAEGRQGLENLVVRTTGHRATILVVVFNCFFQIFAKNRFLMLFR